MIPTNIGKGDKTARFLVAVVIIGLAIAAKSAWGIVALFFLGTALYGRCPAYQLIGVSTTGGKERRVYVESEAQK